MLERESGRRSLHTVGNPLTGMSVGSFGISEGNITGGGGGGIIAYVPNRTASGEAQRLASTTSEWELGREGCIIGP